MSGQILRRKVRIVHRHPVESGTVAERSWRVAFTRALRDEGRLDAEVAAPSSLRLSLAEVLELPMERGLFLMLEGPDEGLGVAMIAPELAGAMVEMLTLGRLSPKSEPRRPTRTDAAMIAPVVEQALRNLEEALVAQDDLIWADGFHFASYLEEPRPLGLLLEEMPYRVLRAGVSLGEGGPVGAVILVLPARGRGRRPEPKADALPEVLEKPMFNARLVAQVELAPAQMDAVLARLRLPLAEAMAFQPGMVLPLPEAGLDRIVLEGQDGRRLTEGKLGQQRGMRAIRLSEASLPLSPAHSAPTLPAGWQTGQENGCAEMEIPPLSATG